MQVTEIAIARPLPSEYGDAYADYIECVPGVDVIPYLAEQVEMVDVLLGHLSDEQGGARYAPGKWSVKEVVHHITNAELTLSCQISSIARRGSRPHASSDESDSMCAFPMDERSIRDLLGDFRTVRTRTLGLLREIPGSAWINTGRVGTETLSVRALAYVIAGHTAHHLSTLWERYPLR